ncbi:sensor histidine kinase [Pedobacter gandavensis]|uniref:sensor histidine kinase n=1 Tax=Pedobacter gandavensis TaxID=2679963 RepID=UPI002931B63B|nr:histidine kinase [Pedobacter gandavensis]
MKISLLTFLIGCLYILNSFAQPKKIIDTAQIKPIKIYESYTDRSLIDNPNRTFLDRFTTLFQYREFAKEPSSDMKVNIANISKNTRYRLYLKNSTNGNYILISDRWTYNKYDSTASILVDRKLFKSPFRYEVSVIPIAELKGKTYISTSKKATYENLFAKPLAYFNLNERSRVRQNFTWLSIFLILVPPIFFNVRRMKTVKAEKEKEKAQLQLDAVRSQLNPHFLFNALAGIQTLMNTNQTERANRYLTRFARLTRAVLKSTDLISLDEERNLLDDYLQMEQLRFNFKYEITTDPNLDLNNVEIPSMLLQPFIENSVKHGIASLSSDGQINIAIFKNDNDLILKIEDNGKGFDTTKSYEGLGFDLSTKRIALLNKIYKQDPILLSMESKPGKTTITITLTKWL